MHGFLYSLRRNSMLQSADIIHFLEKVKTQNLVKKFLFHPNPEQ